MAEINIEGSTLGNGLTELLTAPDIQPGDQPSYQLCKIIWLLHPLGKKMVEAPITMAQSQKRKLSIPAGSAQDRVREKFVEEWGTLQIDTAIYNVAAVARAYGLGSLALVSQELKPSEPIDPKKIADLTISFSIFDPLNTAGSLVLNQDPNAIDFMKATPFSVSGVPYHRSRTVTLMNERPVYIAYTTSAFGFVGRSVFQRALFPLKSFVQTMLTDDLITKKAGVFIAMLKAAGAIIDKIMQYSAGLKRLFIKEASVQHANVISIGTDEKIETLNMQNIDGAYGMARKNILENIAAAADMPAKLLLQESFAEGFGEGSEDAKHVAAYIDGIRVWLQPLYAFFDPIVMRRAWSKDFYKTIQAEFPEFAEVQYEAALYKWMNGFSGEWPSLLTEPESEQVMTDQVKLQGIAMFLEIVLQVADPENQAEALRWAQDNLNENKMMFQAPLNLNFESFMENAAQQREQAMKAAQEPQDEDKGRADAEAKRRRRIAAAKTFADGATDLVATMQAREGRAGARPNSHLNGRGGAVA